MKRYRSPSQIVYLSHGCAFFHSGYHKNTYSALAGVLPDGHRHVKCMTRPWVKTYGRQAKIEAVASSSTHKSPSMHDTFTNHVGDKYFYLSNFVTFVPCRPIPAINPF